MASHAAKHERRGNWIAGAVKHPGALHEQLDVPAGKKIPASKLAAKPGDSTRTKRRKAFARTMNKLHG